MTESLRARLPLWLCAGIAVLCAGCGDQAQTASSQRSGPVRGRHLTVMTPEGRTRPYILYVPTHGPKRRGLMLVFHGAEGTAEQTVRETDFEQAASASGTIVAFMQGYENTWNEGAGHTPARVAHVDDVAYTSAVLDEIESHYPLDRGRIAATGLSNGALLTELLGCELSDRLTLIAPVAGPLPVSVSPTCRPSTPISVLEVHGTADQSIPYGGGHFVGIGGGTTVLSAPATAARWSALDRCGAQRQGTGEDRSVVLDTYSSCMGEVIVQLRSLQGAGHGWPANIGSLVIEFMRLHPRGEQAK